MKKMVLMILVSK